MDIFDREDTQTQVLASDRWSCASGHIGGGEVDMTNHPKRKSK